MDTSYQPPNSAFTPNHLYHLGLQPNSDSWTICFAPRTYNEEIEEKGKEPTKRGLDLVSHFFNFKWHIKVTFQGTLSRHTGSFAKVTRRRKDLENLCQCIDFKSIQLLDDTVTELIVTQRYNTTTTTGQKLPLKTLPETESEYAPIVGHLWLNTQEDPFQVRFPVYHSGRSSAPIILLSEIEIKHELGSGVYEVQVGSDRKSYVYKAVDRPLYEPRDTEVLEKELQNLQLLRGNTGVVELVAAVVSNNPYQTAEILKNNTPTVLRGILLEYHPNGTLKDALDSPDPNFPWYQWAIEITGALARLHLLGITHMDLKPTNIVISNHLNAILIDVSGIGGVTRKWLSPEMKISPKPISEDVESRKQNDIYALGKILSAMADISCNKMEAQILKEVALDAAAEVPPRIPLQKAMFKLSRLRPSFSYSNSLQSTLSGSNPPFDRLPTCI